MRNFILLMLGVFACVSAQSAERIASGGGAITEAIYAMGGADQLVAVDTSSVYPEEATKLPQLGYARQLSAEGILSVKPTVLLVTEDAGPPEVIQQVETAGVKVVRLGNGHSAEASIERIQKIGSELGLQEAAAKVAGDLKKDLGAANAVVADSAAKPKVLFIYTRGGGVMNVSGTDTAADAMIALAGGRNAVSDYTGYKPLTAEGAVAAEPDFILVTSRGLESSGGVDELLKQPGLALTPAGKNRRVIAFDDLYLLGFGPRLGRATLELCQQLHNTPKKAE